MSDRILRNTPATLTVTFYADETAVDPDGNAATFTAVKADGTTHTATTAATRITTGKYSFALPGQSALNELTCTWTGLFGGVSGSIVTMVEIVGGFYVTVAEVRAYDNSITAVKFPYDSVTDARRATEEEFERVCGQAFVKRFNREVLSGDDTNELWLTWPWVSTITKLTFDGTDVLSSYLPYIRVSSDNSKMIFFTEGSGLTWPSDTDIVIEYEHGRKATPFEIANVAKKRIRDRLLWKNARIDDRVAVIQGDNQFGRFNLATPGMDMGFGRYTRASMGVWHLGVPAIDIVLDDFIYEPKGVA